MFSRFLSGLWDGADKDLNRAINHLLGLPEDKVREQIFDNAVHSRIACLAIPKTVFCGLQVVREGQGGGGASPVESKPSKKESKSSKKVSKEVSTQWICIASRSAQDLSTPF